MREKLSLTMLAVILMALIAGVFSTAAAVSHHRTCSCEMIKNRECPPNGP